MMFLEANMRCRSKKSDYLTVEEQNSGVDAEVAGRVAASSCRRLRKATLRRGETAVREVVVGMPSTLKGSYIAGRGSVF